VESGDGLIAESPQEPDLQLSPHPAQAQHPVRLMKGEFYPVAIDKIPVRTIHGAGRFRACHWVLEKFS
jgi:hypothetical protein